MDAKQDQEVGDAVAASALLRQHTASTRLTEAEHAAWVAAAGGRQLGRWIRAEISARLADCQPAPPAVAATRELVAEIRRIGININQIARRLNEGQPVHVAMVAAHQAAEAALWSVHAAVIAGEARTL